MANKLSLLAGRTVPRFVKEEYPQFLNFIKAYFEYLERDGGEFTAVDTMLESVDIDRTVDDFLYYYRKEYMVGFPESMATDIRFVIKKIKDFYSAKGTEKSFEFLFRTIFDVPVEFYYPKVDMLRVSDGAWIQPYYVIPERLGDTGPNPDLFALVDQKIRGYTSGATAYIDKRQLLTISYPELVPNFSFKLEENNWSVFGDASQEINPSLEVLEVERNGAAVSGIEGPVSVGDTLLVDLTVDIESFSNNNTNAKIIIKKDGVLVGEITQSGIYEFKNLSVVADSTPIFRFEMDGDENWNIVYKSISVKNSAQVLMKYGSSLTEIQGEFIAGETVEVISPRVDEDGNPLPPIADFKLMEEIRGQSAIIRPPGRYADTGGHISSTKKIQDSYYYQDFSYELISEIPVKFYEDIIKDLVHPAGFKMFGKVEKKSIDEISLQDLVSFFTILIEWTTEQTRSVEPTDDVAKMEVSKDVPNTHSERNDWDHFLAHKESYQYDALQIGDFDAYTLGDMEDKRSRNYHMVFVNGKKIPATKYDIIDRKIMFETAPEAAPSGSSDSIKMNMEIMHLSHSLQEPNVFTTNGRDVRFRLSDDLIIERGQEVLVFADGIFLAYRDEYSIEQKTENGKTVTDVVFTKVHADGVEMDVIVLDGNMIPGPTYDPHRMYHNLSVDDISSSKPFPVTNMIDSDNTEDILVFVNGAKANSQTSYNLYYDIEEKKYMYRPIILPSELGMAAPYNISTAYMKGFINDVDLIKADGTTTEFEMRSNMNYMKHGSTTILEEHQMPDVYNDQRELGFRRVTDQDSATWQIVELNHNLTENGGKVKIYFNIDITRLNLFYRTYQIGVGLSSISGDGPLERIMTIPKVGKYLYNRELTVTDYTKPLQIIIGHMEGKISNITMSVVDKE